MKKIDWKSRFKNPYFIATLIMSILLPSVGYMGASIQDLTTWGALFDLFKGILMNPFLLGTVTVSIFNAVVDFSTKGVADDSSKDVLIQSLRDEIEDLQK